MQMNLSLHRVNDNKIVVVNGDTHVIHSANQFLELMMRLPASRIVLRKEHIADDFFNLRSGLASDLLQKVVIYSRHLSIVGDFSDLRSKSLCNFMIANNKANRITFSGSVEEALQRLSR